MLLTLMSLPRYRRSADVVASNVAAAVAIYFYGQTDRKRGSRYRAPPQQRHRRTVQEIHDCLGARYFQRAYRMSYESFWKLHDKLKEGISLAHKQYLEKMKRQKRTRRSCSSERGRRSFNSPPPPLVPVPNGKISSSVRLACALRYFAGGSLPLQRTHHLRHLCLALVWGRSS